MADLLGHLQIQRAGKWHYQHGTIRQQPCAAWMPPLCCILTHFYPLNNNTQTSFFSFLAIGKCSSNFVESQYLHM